MKTFILVEKKNSIACNFTASSSDTCDSVILEKKSVIFVYYVQIKKKKTLNRNILSPRLSSFILFSHDRGTVAIVAEIKRARKPGSNTSAKQFLS